jgi:hypothetical protein
MKLFHFQGPLFEGHLEDFRDEDARDEQGGELVWNKPEMDCAGTDVELFEPAAGIKELELHGEGETWVAQKSQSFSA